MRKEKEKYKSELKSIDGIETIGIALNDEGEESLSIGISEEYRKNIPQYIIDDIGEDRVVFHEVGKLKCENFIYDNVAPSPDAERTRPVKIGVSAGHYNITSGTTSYLLTDGYDVYASSNNHVYADTNDGVEGDPIFQPGPSDGGGTSDTVSTLRDYIKIEEDVTVDLAWADFEEEHVNEIPEIGKPRGRPKRPELGDEIIKYGRTTGFTSGTVKEIESSVGVDFGFDVIWFDDQFVTESMSDGGDSGSATLNKDDKTPAGMLFAGSDNSTIHNYADNIEEESGMKIITEKEEEDMTREKLFEFTEEFEARKKPLKFLGMELEDDLIRGEESDITINLYSNENSTYYVKIYVDGEEEQDIDDIPMGEDEEWPVSSKIMVPDSEMFSVTIEGGYEAV